MTYQEQLDSTISGIRSGTLPQTLFVSGPYGAGQVSFVRQVVEEIMPQGLDCPDVFTVALPEDKHSIPLAKVHEARDFLSRSPLVGKVKICIFFDADFMAVEGQNAVLKSIEEPHSSSYILFVSDYKRVLPTILSRCHQIEIRPDNVTEVTLGYRDIASQDVVDSITEYVDILSAPLYQRSNYLTQVLNVSSKAQLSYLLWIWESVHMIQFLAQTDRERYTKYIQVFPEPIQTSLERLTPDTVALTLLTELKESLLFSTRRRQTALENFIFRI